MAQVDTGKTASGRHSAIPIAAGIGLRGPHREALLEQRPAVAWLEAHPENYFAAGGAALHDLEALRRDYPLSLHGVGLSLGSVDPLDTAHLDKLAELIARFEPGLVSEHLSWGSVDGRHFNDLLPLPYTEECLDHFCQRVAQAQDYLGRQILIENPSSYLSYRHSTIPEWEFFAEIPRRTGCALLLDVNNIHVSAHNHGFDTDDYLAALAGSDIREIHLAGFAVKRHDDGVILIDDHGAPVAEAVWTLYAEALRRFGALPTLIEWDSHIPPLATLLEEAASAETLLEQQRAAVA